MMTALCLAAKSGVDVRIMTPGVPDKKMVFLLTQSYYAQLIEAGVKIYEYSPDSFMPSLLSVMMKLLWWEPLIWITEVFICILKMAYGSTKTT